MTARARDVSPSDAGGRAGRGGRGVLDGSGQIALAMMVMNVATYAFTMSAARIIGPVAYGAFVALMNLVLILSVVMLGLQATAARRISADPAHVGQIEREVLRASTRAALVLGGLLLAASPLIDRLLDLDSLSAAVLLAVLVVPMTVTGAQAGILQGERRWRELAILYVLTGVPRLALGLALVLWRPTELLAFTGVTLGYFAPFLYGAFVLRRGRDTGATDVRHGLGPVIKEAVVNSQALFAYFALTNIDMLVGRTVLDAHASGLYAAGLIVTRAVMFLPQFVVVIAFPSMSASPHHARALVRSMAVVSGLGAACVVGTALLPDLALVFAGGDDYAEIRGRLWLFALLGTCMSVLQLLVYSVLAHRGAVSMALVWVAFVAVAGIASTGVSTVSGLLGVVLGVDAVLLAVLLAISVVKLRRPAPAQ